MRRSAVAPAGRPAPAATKVESEVAHLMRRAGFGATRTEYAAAGKKGLAATLGRLIDYDQQPDTFEPPPAEAIPNAPSGQVNALTVWWLNLMLTTNRPLQEKMTLFWHGHFATAVQKVRNPAYMYGQNQLFRQNALGRFDDLLSAVYKDPAMLIWLDGRRNTKAAPNENWGREVMELFTLGHGNYTEDDVHADSRAFTGWTIRPATGAAVFVPRLHDFGVKTLLGQTGTWDGEDAVRILAAHPATGPFLAGRLWRFFASDNPPSDAIKRIASVYYSSGHSIREMVRTLFTLPQFYSPAVRTGHIKSPTEFLVGGIRQLGLTNPDLTAAPRTLALLGQQLFNPPNVGGWPGGPTWINATTMLGRFNWASALTGDFRNLDELDTQAILQASGAHSMPDLATAIASMLGIEPSTDTKKALAAYAGKGSVDRLDVDTKIRGLVHLTLSSPEFQAT